MEIVEGRNDYINHENSNKNPAIASTQRDYIAGEVSKDISRRLLLPPDIVEAHDEGIIHFHDMDYYVEKITNCCLVDLESMLQNGTAISGTHIDKPHSFRTACNIATQVLSVVASNQFGGQTITLSHLAPFVDISRNNIRKQVREELAPVKRRLGRKYGPLVEQITKERLSEEIKDGVQTIQYQILTLMTTNGQTPFVTVYMYLGEVEDHKTKADLALIIEEMLKQRYEGIPNEQGVPITPAFPKLVYALEEDNISEDSEYWYLTELAAKCSAKRLVPDYVSEKQILKLKYGSLLPIRVRRDKWGDEELYGPNPFKNLTDEECMALQEYVATYEFDGEYSETVKSIMDRHNIRKSDLIPLAYPPMGCRAFLVPDIIHYKTYGRLNQGVVTINLVDVALSAKKQVVEEQTEYVEDGEWDKLCVDAFWRIFDERLELCHKALKLRHERLEGTLSDVSPIHWQNGAIARLKPGETIDKYLHNGYSTISLGYAGLYECVVAMTGKSHTDEAAEGFAKSIMQHMIDKCNEWKAEESLEYSLYGTPIESTTYKFAQSLQRRFGKIYGITDYDYITNSYHVNVREKIDPFTKLAFESRFQALSPGGAISYIETSNLDNNIEAVLEVIKFIYDHIIYAELNTKSDYCQVCGYDGEILIKRRESDGMLYWECPNCGNTDEKLMNTVRRTCGYLGSNFWNQGRTQEIRDRYVHLGGDEE